MKALLVAALAAMLLPIPAHAHGTVPTLLPLTSCPGRVEIIQRVNHPENYAGDAAHRTTWAQQTQSEVEACVAAGIISRAYGYYLDLQVMGRIVRYVCLLGDSDEIRNALGQFDSTVIETRPVLLGSVFATFTDELRTQVHSDCRNGRI